MNPVLPRLSIIGGGHLGRTMARLWHEAGVFAIADVVTRSQASANEAVAFIGAGRALVAGASLARADVFLLATPDSVIADAALALAASGLMTPDTVVFHCSGSLTSAVLQGLAPASVASVHPILSFAQPAQAEANFSGSFCGMEGEAGALSVLVPAFEALGARLVKIDASHKDVYHAAAVIASNYLMPLLEAALQAYEAAGISRADALQMLAPLTEGALANALRVGPAAALSGPIARGDFETVKRHEAALRSVDAGLGEFYRLMAERTAVLARRS